MKKKKAKKQKQRWIDVLAVAAFVLQAVEFGLEVWDKRKDLRKARVGPAKGAA